MNGQTMLKRFQIGDTPLISLPGLVRRGQVSLKAEYANPFGSVKDRTAAYLLAWARRTYGPEVRVVESTSGNLGFALAHIGKQFGIRPILIMDSSLPEARISDLRGTGADVVVVQEPRPGMTLRETRIAVAAEIGQRAGHVWLNQYGNSAGAQAHRESTGPEIWSGCRGAVDAIVASVGTGGTICGIGAALREVTNSPLIVGVEPSGSTISGGEEGEYLTAGSGMRGAPDLVLEFRYLIDHFAQVPDTIAARWALMIRDQFNIEVGQTTGAAVAVAALLAEREGYHVVALAPDRGSAFAPAIRRLAATPATVSDKELIQLRPFGSMRDVKLVGK
jgi:cysteine synthase